MANPIKTNSTQGLYLVIGRSAGTNETWLTNNTPGEADLSTYTLYSTYIYFDSVMNFENQFSDVYETDIQRGYRIEADGEGTQKYYTGGHDKEVIILKVETTRTIAEGFETFKKYWNKTARATSGGTGDELELVIQYASETFRQFANQTPALKKYCPIIIMGSTTTESGTTDRNTITITCRVIW